MTPGTYSVQLVGGDGHQDTGEQPTVHEYLLSKVIGQNIPQRGWRASVS